MRTALVHHWLAGWPVDYADAAAAAITASGASTESWGLDYTDVSAGSVTATGTGADSYSAPTPPTAYDTVIDTDNPVSHWKLGTTTIATDRKGITNLPAVNGPISQASALIANNSDDQANTFAAASSQRFQLAAAAGRGTPYNTASFSIEGWINTASLTGSRMIVNRGIPTELRTLDATLRFAITDGTSIVRTLITTPGLATGITYHVVATFDGATMILYLNGAEIGRRTATGITPETTQAPIIGSAGAAGLFDGTIDEVAWYNTALTPARILAHYQAGQPPTGGPTYNDTASGTLTATGTGVETYEPPAAGTVYTDTASGAIASSGNALETAATANSRTGAIIASGTAAESAAHTGAGTATTTASGTGTDNWTIGYTDTATGTITSSGTGTETTAAADARTGTATATGTNLETHTHTNAATGNLTASGTALETATAADVQTGTTTASGASLETSAHTGTATGALTATGTGTDDYQLGATVHTDATAGTLTTSGTATETHTHATAPTGQLTATGTGTEDYQPPTTVYNDAATGTLNLVGTGLEYRTYEDTQIAGLSADGTLHHSVAYADACPGTIRTHGTSTLTTTRNRHRQGHQSTGEPIPPYPAWPTPGTHRRPRRGAHPTGAAGRQRTPA